MHWLNRCSECHDLNLKLHARSNDRANDRRRNSSPFHVPIQGVSTFVLSNHGRRNTTAVLRAGVGLLAQGWGGVYAVPAVRGVAGVVQHRIGCTTKHLAMCSKM
jgi:hypothetical protein